MATKRGFLPEQPGALPVLPETSPISPEDESSVAADERAFEELPKGEADFLEEEGGGSEEQAPSASGGAARKTSAQKRDHVTVEVERILEAELGEYVDTLTPDEKDRFLRKGKEVSAVLADMVRNLRVHVKRALQLIRDWLMTLPGMNKFFLEQEAKIKTDRLLELERAYRDEQKKPS